LTFRLLAPRARNNPNADRFRLCTLHATQLKLALRQYQEETGKPAVTLNVLAPRYFRAIPTDPYDGHPFRYRLSRGERIIWPEDPNQQAPAAPGGMMGGPPGAAGPGDMVLQPDKPQEPRGRLIPPGQGILWSIGDDRNDDGGKQQAENPSISQRGEDIIFLVPLPPK
jgi:hypothetical protein